MNKRFLCGLPVSGALSSGQTADCCEGDDGPIRRLEVPADA